MVFSSTIFLFIFLPLVLLIYYLINIKFRNYFLLLASLFFYAYGEPKFIFIMCLSIVINYIFGFLIHFTSNKSLLKKRLVLIFTVVFNVGLLFYYKYYDFFIENVNGIFGLELPLKHIVLPIGISFFTFQIMSYIFDLYMGKIELQKNIFKLALYISFFPQLIAGPIVRYIDIEKQINKRYVNVDDFAEGLKRFIIGLGKKVLIANTFAMPADEIFSMHPSETSILLLWGGAIAYTLQIYFDFSGYSDMAIGLGRMFGFKFLENFNYPYIARNMQDFWRRWHISLSTWFRDYVYIPLGGNRVSPSRTYINLFIVFLLTGLWHGASWTFVIWGLWHGLFLIIERIIRNSRLSKYNIPYFITWIYTMLVVITGWIIFRADSLIYGIDYIKNMFGFGNIPFYDQVFLKYLSEYYIVFIIAIICATPLLKNILNLISNKFYKLSLSFEYTALIFVFLLSIVYTVTSTYNPFIYFNF